MSKLKKVSVSELKVHALQIIESVNSSKIEVEVYKHGKLVAKITPSAEEIEKPWMGCAEGTVKFNGNPDSILDPIDEKWAVLEE